jgi:citrate lyase subunit beta / citryl-CoA lyase
MPEEERAVSRVSATDARAGIVRTVVFVAAHDLDAIMQASDNGVDALCLDLEDLTPLAAKEQARALWPDVAQRLQAKGILVFARVNGLATGLALDDLRAVCCPELHCVNLPKAESAEEVSEFCRLLAEVEAERGLEPDRIAVRPVIETAAGIRAGYEIAAASPRVAYMGGVCGGEFGDLGGSLGVRPLPDSRESLYLRSKLLVDVRAAGVRYPIGGGSPPTDLAGIEAFARENRALGYDGMQCANRADHIAIVNDVFTPSAAETQRWRAIMPLLACAEAAGESVIDPPGGPRMDVSAAIRARERLALAERLGVGRSR